MVFISNAHNDEDVAKISNPGHAKAEAAGGAKLTPAMEEGSSAKKKDFSSTSVYGSIWAAKDVPKYEMPEEEMPPRIAYKLIHDELAMDGNPYMNLASFVTTYMEPECETLIMENLGKNFIDYEEYPAACELQNRAVNMIARLFNAPTHEADSPESIGVSTVGSSEAIILSVLAMKKRWQKRRKAAGKSTESPNLIMGSNVQVCWEKATRYLDVEERYVYTTETRYVMDPAEAVALADENTIGICAILGSTYTGEYEDVKTLNTLLEKRNAELGLEGENRITIHVDAASGGFVAPFVKPDLEWDFRLPLVTSINVSGHKYGLVYPGVGWAVWRSKEYLPQELVFNINYLGADQASFTLNFSKGAANVVAQYYILIRLGKAGFRAIMNNLIDFSDYLADALEHSGHFEIMSARHGDGLPLVAWRIKSKNKHYNEFDIASRLRERGWTIPAYSAPPSKDGKSFNMLRVVVREDFTRTRVDLLVHDILFAVDHLDQMDANSVAAKRSANKNWNVVMAKMSSLKVLPPDVNKVEKDKANPIC